MPITEITDSTTDFDCLIWDYPGFDPTRVVHRLGCKYAYQGHAALMSGAEYVLDEECDTHGCYRTGPLRMKTHSKGLVVAKFERNWHDDSDFVAVLWNPVKHKIEYYTYATTRAWSYPCHCEIDATAEVLAAAREVYIEGRLRAWVSELETEARRLTPGKTLIVVKGRKIPKGTRGRVIGVKNGMYGEYALFMLEGERKTVSVSTENLEVVYAAPRYDLIEMRRELERSTPSTVPHRHYR